MAILERIVFENLSVGGVCNLFHHGTVVDYLEGKSFVFNKGNVYGLIGEFGEGGVAFSCGIAGNTNYYEGEIYIDNLESSIEDVVSYSWYVGTDLSYYKSKSLFHKRARINKNTIKEQIQYGIRTKKTELDFYTIQKMFDVSSERITRNIEFVSGERWKASAAIGYANGKKIFCYPWMNTKEIERLKDQTKKTIKCLIDNGCIVIIPTTREENVRKIFSNANIITL